MTKSAKQSIRVITIDGPSGSGKSTAARKLAQRLGFAHLDTGAMYRAVTFQALRQGLNLRDSAELINLTKQIDLDLVPTAHGTEVTICGQDVTELIRTVEVTENAHFIASRRGVRDEMVKRQRKLARKLAPLVAEGRDQGTVVFPHAQLKFFLDADPATRARRRYQQLQSSGENVTYEQILSGIQTRDARDSTRSTAPLEVPPGAIIVDTTNMSVEKMVDELARHVQRILSTLEQRQSKQ
ncbi:MAG: (d)CMP kinase [Phycisphaerae bacterium]|nr:(d)CMP kinase [Phycisphaerae bacterium]